MNRALLSEGTRNAHKQNMLLRVLKPREFNSYVKRTCCCPHELLTTWLTKGILLNANCERKHLPHFYLFLQLYFPWYFFSQKSEIFGFLFSFISGCQPVRVT